MKRLPYRTRKLMERLIEGKAQFTEVMELPKDEQEALAAELEKYWNEQVEKGECLVRQFEIQTARAKKVLLDARTNLTRAQYLKKIISKRPPA